MYRLKPSSGDRKCLRLKTLWVGVGGGHSPQPVGVAYTLNLEKKTVSPSGVGGYIVNWERVSKHKDRSGGVARTVGASGRG